MTKYKTEADEVYPVRWLVERADGIEVPEEIAEFINWAGRVENYAQDLLMSMDRTHYGSGPAFTEASWALMAKEGYELARLPIPKIPLLPEEQPREWDPARGWFQ